MKKTITMLIGCSLALAAGAIAQQDDATQSTPAKKKQHNQQSANQAPQSANSRPGQQEGARPHAGRTARGQAGTTENGGNTQAPNAEATRSNANGRAQGQAGQRREGHNRDRESAPTSEQAAPNSSNTTSGTNTQNEQRRRGHNPNRERASSTEQNAPEAAIGEGNANDQGKVERRSQSATQTGRTQANNNNANAKPRKPADVQKIKTEHASFRAQPKPQQVPAVTFNQSHRITGSDQWQGERYTVFRSYQPQWHDAGWYHSHYTRIELIGGGYYYFNNGYWYPAWGYQPSAAYYVYDGPIYAGHQAEPPDRVIADVQAALQEMGYYRGEVDGLLGPLTREALTAYQSDNGLYTTAAIDEPTLDSLGLG